MEEYCKWGVNMEYQKVIKKMTLKEKIALCSGASIWETAAYPQYGIRALHMCDGPHGLRKQSTDHLGLSGSIAATCFPTASALASSWDIALAHEIGSALGKEAVKEEVNIILGPGINMKRNPLCGRNFEYLSEDPFLTGKMAAAWINGVQENGVGVAVKHFAANNQEEKRMSSDSLVDERGLREYYLAAFEMVVKEAHPTSFMSAYNKLNGLYCSDSKPLLWDILREEWGFDGIVITDWYGMNDRIEGFKAGLDLEMPNSKDRFNAEVKEAVEMGELDERLIDNAVERILRVIDRCTPTIGINELPPNLLEQNHQVALKAAASSAVLLKNEKGVFPFAKGMELIVIGALAEKPRYQGAGSSQVNPAKATNLLDGIGQHTAQATYVQGYQLTGEADEALLSDAVEAARSGKQVLLCLGLTDKDESESFDRTHMTIPQNQIALLNAIYAVNRNITAVLFGGSAVEMPWLPMVKALLHMKLSGQAGGLAAADLLFGKINPSGKLAQTYPNRYTDCVSSSYYGIEPKLVPYYESMFCGYRYYDSAQKQVLFPFGFGLSYTTFEYSNLNVQTLGEYRYEVSLDITNTGAVAGAEVVQLYVSPKTNGVYRPEQELKGFAKVAIEPNATARVTMLLDKRSFAIYAPKEKDWLVESGSYLLRIGASSRDIRLAHTLEITGVRADKTAASDWYYTLAGIPGQKDFESIYGPYKPYVPQGKGTYDLTSSVKEMKETSFLCKKIYAGMEKKVADLVSCSIDYDNPRFNMAIEMLSGLPLKSLSLFSPESMPPYLANALVYASNGKYFKAINMLLKGKKKAKAQSEAMSSSK